MKKRGKHNHRFGVLGHIFCAGEHNQHKPHMLRGMTLSVISFLAVFLMGMSFARYYFLHQTVLGQEVVASVLIDLTNETRLAYGETPLMRNPKLENASAMKAEDMATYEYFAHNSPTGVTPWHWIKKAGYDFVYAGENLAVDFTESKDVEDAWMKSPTHKANLLNSKFQEIGISTKSGMIDGHNTIYVVQMFGTPKSAADSQKTIQIETSPTPEAVPAPSQDSPNGEIAGAVVRVATKENTTSPRQDLLAKADTDSQNVASENDMEIKTATAGATHVVTENKNPEYVTLVDENNMLIVADREALENTTDSAVFAPYQGQQVKYASFWQKLIYNFWFDVNYIYKAIVGLIMLALVFLFFTEFRRRHWLHMLYGCITIALLLLLLYVNQSLW